MERTKTRYHEIDALRVVALVLLIIYHIFICYQPFAETIQFLQYDPLLEDYWFIGELLNVWRIPVLFLISGMAVGFILPRRSVKELIHDRMMRLVPPLVFGSFVIVPIFPAIYAWYHGQSFSYIPNPGHLWFVVNLVSYSILLVPLVVYVKKRPENVLIRGLRKTFPFGLLVALPAPLMLETVLSQPFGFAFFPFRFWYGLICYAVGFLFVSVGESFWTSIRRVCHVALPGALVLYLGRMEFVRWDLLRANHWTTALESGLWMLSFLGYGSILLSRPSKAFAYLNKAVFPIYIIHMPVQQLVAFFIFRWKLGPEITFVLHVVLSFVICGLCYEWVIRRLPFLYPVMGMKLANSKKDGTMPEEPSAKPRFWPRFGTGLTLYVLSPLIFLQQIIGVVWITIFGFGSLESGLPKNPDPILLASEPVEFRGHYYQVIDTGESIHWEDAAARCESMGGHLVIINDPEENEFLTSIGAGNEYYHLGASDHEKEGDWRWVDGTPLTYENWHPNEPNNYGGDEDYLNAYFELWPQWNDAGSEGRGFVCEWDELPDSNLIESSP